MLTKKTKELLDAFGFLYEEEAILLQKLVEKLPKESVCVNIGAGVGTSALCVLEKRPDLTDTFYTVDISNHDTPFGGLLNERNAFDGAGMKYPNQIHGDSKEIAKTWDGKKVDFLIIDGDHSREGVRGDITLWEKNLADDAIVVLHDYHSENWAEVFIAVQEFMFDRPDIYTYLDEARTYIAFSYHV